MTALEWLRRACGITEDLAPVIEVRADRDPAERAAQLAELDKARAAMRARTPLIDLAARHERALEHAHDLLAQRRGESA